LLRKTQYGGAVDGHSRAIDAEDSALPFKKIENRIKEGLFGRPAQGHLFAGGADLILFLSFKLVWLDGQHAMRLPFPLAYSFENCDLAGDPELLETCNHLRLCQRCLLAARYFALNGDVLDRSRRRQLLSLRQRTAGGSHRACF